MMLEAIDLAFGCRGAPVGSGVTLAARQGEVLCLLGPNGCGKTTLFKTMLGLIPAQGGRLTLEGRDVSAFSRADFARRVGSVPQADAAYFPFSVIDVVLSTHDPSHAFACGDRVALMHEGRLDAVDSPSEVMTPARLEALYAIRVAITFLASAGRYICAPILATSQLPATAGQT